MNNYLETLNDEVREYFGILSPKFPEWLLEYINTPEMLRIGKISLSCGLDYTQSFNIKYFYSNLEHSVGVALIIWNFTHDKKQTLAGLFHDIATPVFKHCIDFMNGDNLNQESTEERTSDIIKNSKEIMYLLNRDNIKVEEVDDYKIYPIADNDTPKLSADRFEYNFSSGLTFAPVWDLDKIRKIYQNIIVIKNEEGIDELSFKDIEVCEEYIETVSKLWPEWISDKDRIAMQLIADICKSMNIKGYLSIDDLYTLSEEEVINKIINCEDKYISDTFIKFSNNNKEIISNNFIDNKYCINIYSKRRYIIPLILTGNKPVRIDKVSNKVESLIKEYLSIPTGGYFVCYDFDFKPYSKDDNKVLVYEK